MTLSWDKFEELISDRQCVILIEKICEPKNTEEACKVCYEMINKDERLL